MPSRSSKPKAKVQDLQFTPESLPGLYQALTNKDQVLRGIVDLYGLPPLWIRPNDFDSLVLTILEQQVSLASAFAAYTRLKTKLPELTPENFLALTHEDLRACYFSRQKIVYTRELARSIHSGETNLEWLSIQPDEHVRQHLKKLKGIGDWTVDIYLIHCLRRTDVFPIGDLALVNAIRMVMEKPDLSREEILHLSNHWKPLRSVATMLFWHFYLSKKKISILH